MSIAQFANTIIRTKRLVKESEDISNETYQDYLTDKPAHIQPLDDSYGEGLDGSYKKDFLMFCELCDIKQGDKVIDSDGKEYVVSGVEEYEWQTLSHLEVRISLVK